MIVDTNASTEKETELFSVLFSWIFWEPLLAFF